ncbi:MAG TPA: phage holin family protein [Thermoleophilaceae bacterium]|jgi:fructose-specific phosphotransferase system IIC component
MSENGTTPTDTAEKQLGEIVSEVTSKAQLLVREEIELAKAEIQLKVSRIVKGAIAFAAAAFFGLLMLIFLLHTLSWGFTDWLSVKYWVGFGITALILLILTGLAALIGVRLVKKGAPPTPDLAIEEAQATKAALQEVRG